VSDAINYKTIATVASDANKCETIATVASDASLYETIAHAVMNAIAPKTIAPVTRVKGVKRDAGKITAVMNATCANAA